MNIRKIALLAGVSMLAACNSQYEDLRQWMVDTQKQAKEQIVPYEAPTVTPPQPYIPPVSHGLNAFESRRLTGIQQVARGSNTPNLNRPKELLESFSLENLKYVGSLANGKKTSAFIEADGHVYTVGLGNYLGQNFGKIQSITPDKIVLIEMIEDGSGNWSYRKQELPLGSSDNNDDTASNNQ